MSRRSATHKFVSGEAELLAGLRKLSNEMCTTILAEGVQEAVQPILVAARRYAKRSEDTGALRESLTTKVKAYPNTGKAVGLVGPDRGYYRMRRKLTGVGAFLSGGAAARPANYAHLVEYGHRIAKGGTLKRKDGTGRAATGVDGGFVRPKPFIRPAVLTTGAAQAAGFHRGIARGYEKALRKITAT